MFEFQRKSRYLLLTLSTAFAPLNNCFPRQACSHSNSLNSRVSHLKISQLPHSYLNCKSSRDLTGCRSHMTTDNTDSKSNIGNLLNMNNTVQQLNDKSFDKLQFNQDIPLIAINIPAKLCTIYLNEFKDFLLCRPRIKRIYDINDKDGKKIEDRRLIILSENIGNEISLSKLPQNLKDFYAQNDGIPEVFNLGITYENVAVEDILRRLLPDSITEIPSSFEQVGHIAHLNLREEVLEYKYLIGSVILDKNNNIRTVVNKVGSIETEFRTFPMELIAGEDNYNVILKESGAKFNFNFKDVYWNSRLQMEHSRLIDFITKYSKIQSKSKKTIVADMMAGVGPFAIPLANNNISVYANDLNPSSYKYLNTNLKNNHCEKYLKNYNMCGRDFILKMVNEGILFNEVIMNLPQSATDFLDVFIGLINRVDREGESVFTPDNLPRIHVYAFSTAEDPILDIVERCARTMQCLPSVMSYVPIVLTQPASNRVVKNNGGKNNNQNKNTDNDEKLCWGHIVRDVSPKKMMVCLSFKLPLEVAIAASLRIQPYVSAKKNDDVKNSDNSSNNLESDEKDSNKGNDITKDKTLNSKKRNIDGFTKS